MTQLGPTWPSCLQLEIKYTSRLLSEAYETFEGCTKLSSIIIPESIIRIGSRTFKDCASLKTIDIPKSVEEIDYYHTFQGCSSLTSISILENTSYIGDRAFEGCSNLTSTIVIPEKVTMLGGSLFDGCEKLQAVILKPLTPPELRYIDGNSSFPFGWVNLIYVPSSSTDVYKESWKDYKDRIHSIDEL